MRRRSHSFDEWLQGELKTPRARRMFEREYARAGIAIQIAQLREKQGLSQAALARRLHTSQQAVSDIETLKKANVTLRTLERVAAALGRRLVVEFR
jgi:DNA-binding transcriptional regulator YiaG